MQAARDRVFVGRAGELDVFRSALSGDALDLAVLYLHGPGGIGKSMLMRRFAAEARAAGRDVLEVDGRMTEPTPEAFAEEAGAVLTGERAVLLIDTFERCQGLEGWLRDRFLTDLPAGALVVIAGRLAPDAEWTSDPGWASVMRTMSLRNLTPGEAADFLHARGVPERTHGALLAFTGGHPLGLALAATVAIQDEESPAGWEPTQNVIETLLPQLTGEVPSPTHRRALEVCAHAHVTTEALLRTVLGDAAGPTFAWLRELPFVESARHGLFPHDVVRGALEADLRWRDPEGYADLHGRLRRHLFDRIRTVPESGMLRAVGEFLYLYRTNRYISGVTSWRDGEVVVHPCDRADRASVVELTARVEGPESAGLAQFWLDRQPEAFRVYRSTRSGEILGFSAWLRLTEPYGEDVDPVVATAWKHARSTAVLRDGEYLAVSRFHVTGGNYPKVSPIEDLHQWRAVAEIARAGPRLGWSYIAIRAVEFWHDYFTNFGCVPVADRPRVGDVAYMLFAYDWRAQPLSMWAERMSRVVLTNVPGASRVSSARDEAMTLGAPPELTVLSRPEFDAAVRDALRTLRDPEKLRVNPLARSRLVVEHGAVLRDVLIEAVEALAEELGGEKYRRAVAATYVGAATTQESAAARLGLPFGTYRRHLGGGVDRVCDALWRQEIFGTAGGEHRLS
ncbi:ATP-binding protein [Streptomyces sp. NBC_00878]|uniref:ATP-binding protein n=1 Tax=Streptomyces sp. NBC_00878 TaxID=2975854 RepID=UPI00225A21B4|nr:ATP-binding protein [Streptomyces sp. NBC_00878]MCX4904374.1 ATP-binding protein [Streptomyces sp. NBC_00878]